MSDSTIPNSSAAVASSNHKDFSKKKRANRTAKLKQGKLDARRGQWLSQGLVIKKGDGCKEEATGGGSQAPERPSLHSKNRQAVPVEKLKIKTSSETVIYGNGSSMHHHYSDSESLPSNSPTSHTSSVLGSNDSGVNFTTSSRSSSSSGRSSSSSSSTHGFCSGHMSDNEEDGGDNDAGDDDCLDDWEAVADALEAKDKQQQDCSPSAPNHANAAEIDISNANLEIGGKQAGNTVNCCAWHPDDAYRPQNLPNLSKQYTFPLNSERQLSRGSVWGSQNIGPAPASCPICIEPLDFTDSSFLPCSCGFRLCLFCHKRILEEDGRCPGCRKKYEFEPVEGETTLDGGSLTFRLTRSCSMITRS